MLSIPKLQAMVQKVAGYYVAGAHLYIKRVNINHGEEPICVLDVHSLQKDTSEIARVHIPLKHCTRRELYKRINASIGVFQENNIWLKRCT